MKSSVALDRIAIVLAILAAFPGGFIALAVTYHLLNDVHPAVEVSLSQADEALIWWKIVLYIIGSIMGAVLSFFLALFGIRGVTSVLKKISSWLIEMLKVKKNEKG